MVKSRKSLSKTLIISVTLATLLSTVVQTQSVQAATSKASKGKGSIVVTQPAPSKEKKTTPAKDKKETPSKPGKGKGDVDVKKTTTLDDQKAAAAVNTLIAALPKVDKLIIADVPAVNKAYAAYTALSKSQKALLTPSYSGKITAAINKIATFKGDSLKALSELNSGKKAFSNFVKAGVTGAVDVNNTLYFTEIAKAKEVKGSALTLAEIQAIVDTVNKNVSTATVLVSINAGTEAFADFAASGITGALEENKAAYDSAIADAKKIKGSDLTLEEVQTLVNTKNQTALDFKTAQVVINQIAALDNTKETYTADVAAAKEAYNLLTDAQKALVTNYAIITNAV